MKLHHLLIAIVAGFILLTGTAVPARAQKNSGQKELSPAERDELEDYQRILRDETYNDVSNKSESSSRARIENRLKQLHDQAQKEQELLATDFLKIKSSASWFLSAYCLESTSGHFKK